MIDPLQIAGLTVSVLLLAIVLELVRRRKLIEEYSFLWILFSLALLAVSLSREALRTIARWAGVLDPPLVFVVLLVAMVFAASLYHSVVVSRQRRQIERLIEETAILSAELRDLRADQSRRTSA